MEDLSYNKTKNPMILGRLSLVKLICFGKIIDVGCGLGETFGENAVNLDLEPEMEKINLIKKMYPVDYERFLKKFPKLRIPNYVQADASEKIPFENKSFDCAVLSEVLEHVQMDKCISILKECSRVADFVVITVPNEWEWPSAVCFNRQVKNDISAHINFFNQKMLFDLVAKASLFVVYYLKVNLFAYSHHILVVTNEPGLPVINVGGTEQVIGLGVNGSCPDEIVSVITLKRLEQLKKEHNKLINIKRISRQRGREAVIPSGP